MHQGKLCQLQDAGTAAAFRLSPEEMWGIAGETLDGLMVRFPMKMVAPTDLDSADAATHFAALDELQNQNAQLHATQVAERKKKEEAIQALQQTQRSHEAKEKQHREREQSLLQQLEGAESKFAKLQTSLEKEKSAALGKLKAEIGRLQATLKEQEAAFRRTELELVREKQDALESCRGTSTSEEPAACPSS